MKMNADRRAFKRKPSVSKFMQLCVTPFVVSKEWWFSSAFISFRNCISSAFVQVTHFSCSICVSCVPARAGPVHAVAIVTVNLKMQNFPVWHGGSPGACQCTQRGAGDMKIIEQCYPFPLRHPGLNTLWNWWQQFRAQQRQQDRQILTNQRKSPGQLLRMIRWKRHCRQKRVLWERNWGNENTRWREWIAYTAASSAGINAVEVILSDWRNTGGTGRTENLTKFSTLPRVYTIK